MFKKIGLLFSVAVLSLSLGGCGQWNIFKWAHKEGGSSDTTVLVADGQALLDEGNYAKAEEVFEKAMLANLGSSEANYGYARAVIAASGLGLADLISSVIQQAQTGTSAPLPAGNPFINFVSAQSVTAGPQLLDPTKLNLTKLYEVSKKAIDPLQRIADNKTDGVIPADDFDVNFNLAFLLVIRGVCGVLDTDGDGYPAETTFTKNGNTVDILGVDSNFKLVNPDDSASIFDSAGNLTDAFKNKFGEYTATLKDVLKQRLAEAIDDIKLVVVETSYGRAGGYLKVALDKISPESAKELEDNSTELKSNLENAKTKIEQF